MLRKSTLVLALVMTGCSTAEPAFLPAADHRDGEATTPSDRGIRRRLERGLARLARDETAPTFAELAPGLARRRCSAVR